MVILRIFFTFSGDPEEFFTFFGDPEYFLPFLVILSISGSASSLT